MKRISEHFDTDCRFTCFSALPAAGCNGVNNSYAAVHLAILLSTAKCNGFTTCQSNIFLPKVALFTRLIYQVYEHKIIHMRCPLAVLSFGPPRCASTEARCSGQVSPCPPESPRMGRT